MNTVLHQVQQSLLARGHIFLEEAAPPRAVKARSVSSIIMASLRFERGVRTVVVKPISPDANITSPQTLYASHERIRAQDASLARILPKFYGHDESGGGSIFMEFINGASLQDLLTGWASRLRKGFNERSLRKAARGLFRLHRLDAAPMGVPGEARRNLSYLEDFEANWRDPLIRPYLPVNLQDPRRFYALLSGEFRDRVGQSVVMSDAQLKNILVSADGVVHFIDIDYVSGNPAVELAQFMCSLDRLRLRHPLSYSSKRIFALKRTFLDAYFQEAAPAVAEDLVFFYPHILLRTFRQHLNKRPWFLSYLLRYYGRRLRSFLIHLERQSTPWSQFILAKTSVGSNGRGRAPACWSAEQRIAKASLSRAELDESRSALSVPLRVQNTFHGHARQPVTVGIPLPRGRVHDPKTLVLCNPEGRQPALQTQPLARWPDGSVKWLLADFLLDQPAADGGRWTLCQTAENVSPTPTGMLHVAETEQAIVVDTGAATFHLDRMCMPPFTRVVINSREVVDPTSVNMLLTDAHGETASPRVERVAVETRGPVRATVRLEGTWQGRVPCRFVVRCCFFAGTGLVRLSLTVHNPQRARHPGGMWDLGDPGSMLFKDLSLRVGLVGPGEPRIHWTAQPGQPAETSEMGPLEIYQDSSGGAGWQSSNHINREGRVPCSFRGYRVRAGDKEACGLRASPTVSLEGVQASVTAAMPEFWQQFPKAIEVEGRTLRLGLFPGQWNDVFELQGGEQKTHTVWLDFQLTSWSPANSLSWVHAPARIHVPPEWVAATGAIPYFAPVRAEGATRLAPYLEEAIGGPNSLFAKREVIDEYGWRNYGEVFADHEAAYHTGPCPLISHYNNQYDLVYGALLQHCRTGDHRWLDLGGPLARHICDIDIYHTTEDRASYNGGLFWFTDHFKDAATCTHRTYSRANQTPDNGYGGGPSSNHNFTTGLLHYYFLTGDPNARDVVLSLADWVVAMDDGTQNVLGLFDPGPTGAASATTSHVYHGPGRGCGNSINALLDAWVLTDRRSYLEKAELLIRRSVHPADDVAALDLRDVEKRWSYTVFFVALGKYLRLKADAGEIDLLYAYAQASLLHYAQWMLDNEKPYFDHPEKLEYPTETWAGQEFRKANVLRLAAEHAVGPMRSRLIQRGEELAERAWSDLLRFESRHVARAIALVLVEGTTDAYFRTEPMATAPAAPQGCDFGKPQGFLSQKARVLVQLKTARGWGRTVLRLANPKNWWRNRPRERPM